MDQLEHKTILLDSWLQDHGVFSISREEVRQFITVLEKPHASKIGTAAQSRRRGVGGEAKRQG